MITMWIGTGAEGGNLRPEFRFPGVLPVEWSGWLPAADRTIPAFRRTVSA